MTYTVKHVVLFSVWASQMYIHDSFGRTQNKVTYIVLLHNVIISRNGPYIRGHPVVLFHIEFQTCLIYSKNRFDYNVHFS